MDVNPVYKTIKNFRGRFRFYMIESKDLISNIGFKLINENGNLVIFNGQSVFFRLSIEEVKIF